MGGSICIVRWLFLALSTILNMPFSIYSAANLHNVLRLFALPFHHSSDCCTCKHSVWTSINVYTVCFPCIISLAVACSYRMSIYLVLKIDVMRLITRKLSYGRRDKSQLRYRWTFIQPKKQLHDYKNMVWWRYKTGYIYNMFQLLLVIICSNFLLVI